MAACIFPGRQPGLHDDSSGRKKCADGAKRAACCRAQGIRPAGELTVITTDDVRAAMAAMAARFYGEPSRDS